MLLSLTLELPLLLKLPKLFLALHLPFLLLLPPHLLLVHPLSFHLLSLQYLLLLSSTFLSLHFLTLQFLSTLVLYLLQKLLLVLLLFLENRVMCRGHDGLRRWLLADWRVDDHRYTKDITPSTLCVLYLRTYMPVK